MDRETCEQLINKLATGNALAPSTKPVAIGKVLEELSKGYSLIEIEDTVLDVLAYWEVCGYNKSLNKIMDEGGFEEANFTKTVDDVVVARWNEQLKDPDARELFNFLNKIFNGS
jgi:hypothetical protein